MRDGDLDTMNQRIARHCGWQVPRGGEYLSYVPRCVARPPSVRACQEVLRGRLRTRVSAFPPAGRINKQYLEFIRTYSQKMLLGEWDWLVILHASVEQARYFAELSNEEIATLAANWEGTVFEVTTPVVELTWPVPLMAQHAVTGWMGVLPC